MPVLGHPLPSLPTSEPLVTVGGIQSLGTALEPALSCLLEDPAPSLNSLSLAPQVGERLWERVSSDEGVRPEWAPRASAGPLISPSSKDLQAPLHGKVPPKHRHILGLG